MKTGRNEKIHEVCRLPIIVYRGSWAVEIVPGAKNSALQPLKTARNEKFTGFIDFQNNVYRGSWAVEIVPGAKNREIGRAHV